MRIRVRPGFYLAAGLLAALDRWGVLPPFALAAGLHELGHLAALWALEIPVYQLELRAGGAVIRAGLQSEPREAWALAAGPGVNLLLAPLFWRLWPTFALCCLLLGVSNLLPLPGRDGGRLIRLSKQKSQR